MAEEEHGEDKPEALPSVSAPAPKPAPPPKPPPKPTELTVLLPALDEAGTIGTLISEIRKRLTSLQVPFEVLVMDGGSTDGTPKAALKAGARVVPSELEGYGGALRHGLLIARGKWALTMDCDGSQLADAIPRVWERRDKADVVLGSRYAAGGEDRRGGLRPVASRSAASLYRRRLGAETADWTSGLRLYRLDAMRGIALSGRGLEVLPEALARLHAAGRKVIEVAYVHSPRALGRSKARPVATLLAAIRLLRRLKPAATPEVL